MEFWGPSLFTYIIGGLVWGISALVFTVETDDKIPARLLLLTPVWPLVLTYLVFYGIFRLTFALPTKLQDIWRQADFPTFRTQKKELGSGQLSISDAAGGELSRTENQS